MPGNVTGTFYVSHLILTKRDEKSKLRKAKQLAQGQKFSYNFICELVLRFWVLIFKVSFLFLSQIPGKKLTNSNWVIKESWIRKSVVSPLDCKEIQPVHPKGNQCWIFIGRTDAEAETPILWPPDAKNWLIGKDPDAGNDWKQEEKGTTEDEMVEWHHQLNGHEFE